MNTYEITTNNINGNKVTIRYEMDMTTPEFINHIKTQLYDRCHGTTTVCRVFNNKKIGKQYKVF